MTTTEAYPGLALELDDEATPVDVFADARNIAIRRGLSVSGLSDNLEPGVCTFELEGPAYNPMTNPLTRPGRPVRVVLGPGVPDAPPPPPGPDPALVGTSLIGVPSYVEVTEVPYKGAPTQTLTKHSHRLWAHFDWMNWNADANVNGWGWLAYTQSATGVWTSVANGFTGRPGTAKWTANANGSWDYDLADDIAFTPMGTHTIVGVTFYWSSRQNVPGYNHPGATTTGQPPGMRPQFWFGPKTITRTDGRDIPQGVHGAPPPPPPVLADPVRVFTGTINRARLGIAPRDSSLVVYVEATDAIPDLGTAPHATAIGGTFAQRIRHITDPLGIVSVVHDTEGPKATPALPTNETTALGNLRLVRDTNHGIVFVDKNNHLQAYADRDRPLTDVSATFTDTTTPDAIHYTALEPVFDTAELVNVVTVESLTGDGAAISGTYTDADSLAVWGPGPGSVTVNEGQPDAHAYRYLEARADPTLTTDRVSFNASEDPAAAAALELYQTIRVIRAGLLDETTQVLALEHLITHRRWTVAVTCRRAEGLPTRWVDLPPALTWAEVDPALSWFDVVTWTP